MIRKRFCLLIILSSFCFLTKVEASTLYKVEIKPGSTLKIHGLTNVNTFDLFYYIKKAVILYPLVTLSDSCYSLTTSSLQIPIRHFETKNEQLKSDFLDLVKEKQYPLLTLSTNCFYFLKSTVTNNITQKKGVAEVAITLGGITRFYNIRLIVTGDKTGNNYLAEGHRTINIRDFNLEPPKKFFGLIQVKEMIEIDFNLSISIFEQTK